jgi:hypothetical protein
MPEQTPQISSPSALRFRLAALVIVGFTALKASKLVLDLFAGNALNLDTLGSFAVAASFLPTLGVFFIFRDTATNTAIDEALNIERVFVESTERRWLTIVVSWSLLIGFFINMLVSPQPPDSFLAGWFDPLVALALCSMAVITCFRRPYRLVLSTVGIDASNLKNGPIAWRDIRDVELRGRYGMNYLAIILDNPKKYGRWRRAFAINNFSLAVSPDDLLAEINRRHAMFGSNPGNQNSMQIVPPLGQTT